jgi:cystathionine gamma-synthase
MVDTYAMSDFQRDSVRIETTVVHAGRPPRVPGAPVNPTISLSSTYIAGPEDNPELYAYAREHHETGRAFEDALGQLEGGLALAYGSGMAATTTVMGLVPIGGVVVVPNVAYTGALNVARTKEERGEIIRRPIDTSNITAIEGAIQGAHMLWIETPTNPTLAITDIKRAAEIAHAAGAMLVVDSTFATPMLTHPLSLGADVVIHSVTKWIAGHSDLLMGATVVKEQSLYDKLQVARVLNGAVIAPFEAWLALRGMRTLAIRVKEACSSAEILAERLASHPAISRVSYPGLKSHPQHELARVQMSGRFGSIIAIELHGGKDAAMKLCDSTNIWMHGTSIGGVESLLERRRRWKSESSEVDDSLIRLSVGIENVEDLWSDLESALNAL